MGPITFWWLAGSVLVAGVGLLMLLHSRTRRYTGSVERTIGLLAIPMCWAWPIYLAFLPVGLLTLFLAELFQKWDWI